ncbi:MAG: hypothetical protein RLZZ76_50 [Candidatus Parcubacteria bacterium]|jgi:A/G-specific adenine glycosylase
MNTAERNFVNRVKQFYKQQGRHSLPWRKTKDTYKILVSEVMLQQTQVDRVIPKYKVFLKQFPKVESLASAPLGEVLRAWQGLGYNRRAKMLHSCAKEIVESHTGRFPKDHKILVSLPGIGPYTASAVLAFACNEPVVLIETNVRTVFIHHFFSDQTDVTDAEILALVERTLDRQNPREWYYALMDYGSYLKKTVGNKNTQSSTYATQSTFKGSDRQIRGALVRLLAEKPHTRVAILKALSAFEDLRVDAQLQKLIIEKMIERKGRVYSLPR